MITTDAYANPKKRIRKRKKTTKQTKNCKEEQKMKNTRLEKQSVNWTYYKELCKIIGWNWTFDLWFVLGKFDRKCERKKIKRKNRRKGKVKENTRDLKLLNYIYKLLQTHFTYFSLSYKD